MPNAHLLIDGRSAADVAKWVSGVLSQLRGDDLLARGEQIHGPVNNPTTGNRKMKDALGILREADSEIVDADTLPDVHVPALSASLLAHVTDREDR